MTGFALVDEPHTTIMYSDAVGSLVVSFLKSGSFAHE